MTRSVTRMLAVAAFAATLEYPMPSRGTDATTYYGITVADPYRWMEKTDAPATKAWVTSEKALTASYLSGLPLRAPLRRRLEKLWRYRYATAPRTYGALRVRRAPVGMPKRVVFFARALRGGRERVVLDTGRTRSVGAIPSDSVTFSPHGRYVAFSTLSSDGKVSTWHVRNVRTLKMLGDRIAAAPSSTAVWTKDDRGFFYETVAASGKKAVTKVRYHTLGQAATLDAGVFSHADLANSSVTVDVSEDGRWLVVTTATYGNDILTRIFYGHIGGGRKVRELFKRRPGYYQFAGTLGARLLFAADASCPDTCVRSVDPLEPGKDRVLLPDTGANMLAATVAGGNIFALYVVDAHSTIVQYDATGRELRTLALPGLGTVDPNAFGDGGSGELSVSFSSFVLPPTALSFRVTDGSSTTQAKAEINYDPKAFVTEQKFFTSRDGTRVPMFVTRARSVARDGRNPTILYVYGGFGRSEQPVWTPEIVTWLSIGGVYAVVNARGGGEYGAAWHLAGSGLKKQHSIDDTLAAASALQAGGYTDAAHLAVRGDSNGGFVAAAAVIQRPDLFAALLTREGLLDLVRYDAMLPGTYWQEEFGSKTAGFEQLQNILRLSPVESLRPGMSYPAALIQTGTADDIVSPAHSYKFVATLQADQASSNPVLLRVAFGAGHHGGEALARVIDESVDQYSFLLHVMNVTTLR